MPGMASMSTESPGKPKLDRRNAKKIDYEPSDLSSPSAFKAQLDKDASGSFRIIGYDSKEKYEKYCEELGLAGGVEALSIPQEDWKAGKSKAGSMDRFIADYRSPSQTHHQPSSRFLDRRNNDEFAMPSSSGKPIASGARVRNDHRDNVNALKVNDPIHADRQQSAEAIDLAEDIAIDGRLHHGESTPTRPVVHAHPFQEVNRRDDRGQVINPEVKGDFSRLSKSFEQVPNQAVLLHPPAIYAKSDPLLSNQSLDGVVPNEDMNHRNNKVSDDDHGSASNTDGFEAAASENDTKEHIGFVSEVVVQHSASAKQQIQAEDGECLKPQTPEEIVSNMSVQSWRKLDMLGSGSFGTVYEALSEDGVYFAVKEVSLSENDSKAQQCVAQLEQEIDFLSKFHHENIVRYLGAQRERDKLYIFLELVTRGSLSSNYQKYMLFDSQIRLYTRQILNGLKYLHERKIMHRDIKCANILVDVSGKVKLADFGLAKQISRLDGEKSCKGSAYWMAPEVINPKQTYSLPADIWSLGCTVLEMMTRKPPFGDIEWHRVLWKVGHGEAPPIPEGFSDEAKDFIQKCLEVNPLRRPTAVQLLEHPFVQYTGRTGFTPNNSFTQDFSALHAITEDNTLSG